jgi:hypothetical protein
LLYLEKLSNPSAAACCLLRALESYIDGLDFDTTLTYLLQAVYLAGLEIGTGNITYEQLKTERE